MFPFTEMRISILWIAKKGNIDPFSEMKDNDKHDIYRKCNAVENVHVYNNNNQTACSAKKKKWNPWKIESRREGAREKKRERDTNVIVIVNANVV